MPIRLSGKEIVKALSNDGWRIERVHGSHHIMRHADGRQTSVSVHGSRNLPAGGQEIPARGRGFPDGRT
jgi:predicted RNA binding protein YcfA (HicA-like mRNA interferase family)